MDFSCFGGTHSGGYYFGQQGFHENIQRHGLLEVTQRHMHYDFNRIALLVFNGCSKCVIDCICGQRTFINIDNSS